MNNFMKKTKKTREFIILSFATFFGLGRMPFSKGTWGTLGAFVLWLFVLSKMSSLNYSLFLLVFLFFSIYISSRAVRIYKIEDCQDIVIDEVIGFFVATIGYHHYIDYKFTWGVFAFILFRVFDIFKPQPVRIFEKLKGGTGVVLDDVMAGAYASVILNISFYFIF